ncbi:MAG TPA: FAD-dependent oxidoreductase [Candidatus Marinimicrobia bacterium]|nr:FAD-dependent oxidoreductase [Candidatus Neomarinimicrobiota bacterium]
MKKHSRRNFLKSSMVLGAGAIMPKGLTNMTKISTKSFSDHNRIIIVGAGLAGLACAYDLDQSGYNVLLLEARSRPGGRVRTYRDTFADGLYAEMGAEYVDSSDKYLRKYCEDFGLKVLPAKQYDGIYVRDQHISMKDLKSGKKNLPFNGIKGGKLFGQESAYIQDWIEKVRSLGPSSAEVQALDKMSVADVLRKGGAPQDIIDLYTYTNATESTTISSQMSALNMVLANSETSAFSENTEEGRILGGNDQVPKIFAKKLGEKIRYNRPIVKIEYNEDRVTIYFAENGKRRSMSGNNCVLALPVSILRSIKIDPPFSDSKMHCIRNQSYGHVMKVAMQYRRRFWDEPGSIGQRVFTDTPLRRVYHFSIDQPGPRGILLSFTSGSDAERLGRMNEQRRMKVAQETCAEIWNDAPQYWEGGVTKYWNKDPWLKASYSVAGVGQKDFREILAQPEGRFHFAGEHTSIYRASMNGAIESGIRAFKEIVKRI